MRMGMKREDIHAVDFDGTLSVGAEWPEIGQANLLLFAHLISRRKCGHKVILWTCREGQHLEDAMKFCTKYGLEFDAVNDNLQECKDFYQNNSRKVFAHHYYDDRNKSIYPGGMTLGAKKELARLVKKFGKEI